MARAHLARLLLPGALAVATPAVAQAPADPLDLAEQAAERAERAAAAAAEAAHAARAAVDAIRTTRGQAPVAPSARPEPPPTPPDVPASVAENLPVTHPTDRALQFAQSGMLTSALARSVANGPNDGLLKSARGPDVQFSVTEKEKVASVSMSFDLDRTSPGNYIVADQFTLSGSGKLDDNGDRSIAGLKGFANGSDVSLAYSHYWTPVKWSAAEKGPVAVARQNCLDQKARARGGAGDAAAVKADQAACNPYDYKTGVSMFVSKYNPEGLTPLLDSVLPGRVDFWGVKITGNQAAYKFLDRAAFAEQKQSHFAYSATAYRGVLLAKGATSFTGSFTYKRDYDANDPVTLCQAIASSTLTQCITSADGAPARKEQDIIALEVRHAFDTKIGSFASLAVAPELSVDVRHDAYSVVVPVYFAGEDTGKLRAGVRAIYLNQKDEKKGGRDDQFSLGVFVGVPFSVFPN